MKFTIIVRLVLTFVSVVLSYVVGLYLPIGVSVKTADAALGQMANSDAAFIGATAGMRIGAMLTGMTGLILFVLLVLIWGSLLLAKKDSSKSDPNDKS